MVSITGQYTKRLSEYAAGLTFDDLPQEIVDHVKRIILNQIACSLWGWKTDAGPQVYDVLKDLGGAEESTVIGADRRMLTINAAAVNAALASAPMTDDTHLAGLIHSGHATVPPALAETESRGLGGKDLITAVVAANEVGIRIGRAVSPEQDDHYNSVSLGWRVDLKCTFCSAVASAKVLGLGPDQIGHAIGIAASSGSGLTATGQSSPYSGSLFAWDDGRAVQGGMLAARLAARGMTDGPYPLEGEQGWVRTYTAGHGRLEWLTEGLGTVYETGKIILKTRCNSAMVHLAIDATYDLVNQHSITADQVDKLKVRGQRWLQDNLWRTDVKTYQDGIFSLPYSIALVILEPGPMTTPDQVVKHLEDPVAHSLMSRFEVEVEPTMPLRTQMPAKITIVLKDGRVVEKQSPDLVKGTYPEYPMEPGELETKFRRAGAGILEPSQLEQVIELVDHLEELERVSDLTRLLRRGS